MRRSKKIRVKKFIVKILKSKWLDLINLILIILIVVPLLIALDLDLIKYVKFDIVISVSITLLIGIIIKIVLSLFEASLEDANKLTIDYNKLVSKYIKNLILEDEESKADSLINYDTKVVNRENSLVIYHCNEVSKYQKNPSSCNLYTINKNGVLVISSPSNDSFFIFPVIMHYLNTENKEIKINDSLNMYQLPSFIESNFNELISAHVHSNIYNSPMIRLKDIIVDDKYVNLFTERTTFYNTLVTNRSIDFKLSRNVSVREMFEYNPKISPLSTSQLSNQIGYQVIIETSDNEIIFVYRSKKVSVAKKTLAGSVSASLKTKYALNSDNLFTIDSWKDCILKESKDELGLTKQDFDDFTMNENLVSFYGDLVEGGKPHFVMYLKSNKDKEYIRKAFNNKYKKSNKSNKNIMDGNKIHFYPKDKLEDIIITPDLISLGDKLFNSVPSYTASLVMFISYYKARENIKSN